MVTEEQPRHGDRRSGVRTPWVANRIILAAFLAGISCGCGGASSSSVLRSGSPEEAAAKVLELYDADKDGKIVSTEMTASPGLIVGLPRIDANRDNAIDLSEMTSRFAKHDVMSNLVAFELNVTSKRVPLDGATVTFIPEPFMGEGKQSYAGTSANGACTLRGQERSVPGVPTGYYTVHIVHSASGVDVKLGCEVADDTPSPNRIALDTSATTASGTASGR